MDKVGAYKYPEVIIFLFSYSRRTELSNLLYVQELLGHRKLLFFWEKMEQEKPHSLRC